MIDSKLEGAVPDGRLPTATIVRRRDCTSELFQLWLEPAVAFRFTPGQYITIGAAGIERPYSIVSAPSEPHVELFIEYLPPEHGGTLTPLLYRSRAGDTLSMRRRAKGRFTLRPGVRNHVMVATVTGVAPYVSMIRQFVHDRERGLESRADIRFFVLQGASYRDELVYDGELCAVSRRHHGVIEYVGSVSRPDDGRNAGWRGPTGRINLLIDEWLDRWQLSPGDTLVYLCGHPGMIDDARGRLVPRGWPVAFEQFWRP